MGRLQWHMLQFKLSLDPCSSEGPAGAQGGIHYSQTQAGLVSASIMTPAFNTSNLSCLYSYFTRFNKLHLHLNEIIKSTEANNAFIKHKLSVSGCNLIPRTEVQEDIDYSGTLNMAKIYR